ncbi:hypothetical protein SAICODRAFT_17876 [Saitoella complicata NRRL Y-17804]|uniref:Uncharacterized protein n=1 Tax=Saitoella complicata (strain BCRC 22490 / CBS 7301 / JCM 7358 / NBRC 10748 / NRRL Y-17804) TaxID=698492 RepID=A0A0E9N7H1_SAICN|nr:uncharacterized protein SAICODRAFT_17876 [Saitoella complicata NRRL Y-17804]ODQ54316.1 hypothetical protein SAICODRAFT_17876 [Saitoella complicata NRRL Y-17804]GAO45779.1 hypothetical protein G7K_0030-t1 [Saitoella complicata NRRL Y-17804]
MLSFNEADLLRAGDLSLSENDWDQFGLTSVTIHHKNDSPIDLFDIHARAPFTVSGNLKMTQTVKSYLRPGRTGRPIQTNSLVRVTVENVTKYSLEGKEDGPTRMFVLGGCGWYELQSAQPGFEEIYEGMRIKAAMWDWFSEKRLDSLATDEEWGVDDPRPQGLLEFTWDYMCQALVDDWKETNQFAPTHPAAKDAAAAVFDKCHLFLMFEMIARDVEFQYEKTDFFKELGRRHRADLRFARDIKTGKLRKRGMPSGKAAFLAATAKVTIPPQTVRAADETDAREAGKDVHEKEAAPEDMPPPKRRPGRPRKSETMSTPTQRARAVSASNTPGDTPVKRPVGRPRKSLVPVDTPGKSDESFGRRKSGRVQTGSSPYPDMSPASMNVDSPRRTRERRVPARVAESVYPVSRSPPPERRRSSAAVRRESTTAAPKHTPNPNPNPNPHPRKRLMSEPAEEETMMQAVRMPADPTRLCSDYVPSEDEDDRVQAPEINVFELFVFIDGHFARGKKGRNAENAGGLVKPVARFFGLRGLEARALMVKHAQELLSILERNKKTELAVYVPLATELNLYLRGNLVQWPKRVRREHEPRDREGGGHHHGRRYVENGSTIVWPASPEVVPQGPKYELIRGDFWELKKIWDLLQHRLDSNRSTVLLEHLLCLLRDEWGVDIEMADDLVSAHVESLLHHMRKDSKEWSRSPIYRDMQFMQQIKQSLGEWDPEQKRYLGAKDAHVLTRNSAVQQSGARAREFATIVLDNGQSIDVNQLAGRGQVITMENYQHQPEAHAQPQVFDGRIGNVSMVEDDEDTSTIMASIPRQRVLDHVDSVTAEKVSALAAELLHNRPESGENVEGSVPVTVNSLLSENRSTPTASLHPESNQSPGKVNQHLQHRPAQTLFTARRPPSPIYQAPPPPGMRLSWSASPLPNDAATVQEPNVQKAMSWSNNNVPQVHHQPQQQQQPRWPPPSQDFPPKPPAPSSFAQPQNPSNPPAPSPALGQGFQSSPAWGAALQGPAVSYGGSNGGMPYMQCPASGCPQIFFNANTEAGRKEVARHVQGHGQRQ